MPKFLQSKPINVLMCGGRRTGKTAIMAAMEKNVQDRFPRGDIQLRMQNSGDLAIYRKEQASLFDDDNCENMKYYANDLSTSAKSEYGCEVTLKGASGLGLNFIDVPGEWFVHAEREQEMIDLLRESQIVVIAVDSPHLLEEEENGIGYYHDVFNRPEQITKLMQIAFQGTEAIRMILFVPVKCELYRNNGKNGRTPDMLSLKEQVRMGYGDLFQFFSGDLKDKFEVVIAPCVTMGGMKFNNFVPPRDEDGSIVTDEYGKELQSIIVNSETGNMDMTWLSEYTYLVDQDGERYYAPEDCDQPLLYILLYLVGFGKLRDGDHLPAFLKFIKIDKVLNSLKTMLFSLPDQAILDECKDILLPQVKTGEQEGQEGFAIINDPNGMFH